MVIVYFDGYCNLCNGFVDYLILRDHAHRLHYASLQGRTAAERLPAELRENLSTLVLQESDRLVTESTAAILALAYLGGAYRACRILLLVPRALRDVFYRWVAKHRYQLAGRRPSCRLPTPEERALFLD